GAQLLVQFPAQPFAPFTGPGIPSVRCVIYSMQAVSVVEPLADLVPQDVAFRFVSDEDASVRELFAIPLELRGVWIKRYLARVSSCDTGAPWEPGRPHTKAFLVDIRSARRIGAAHQQ